MIVDFYDPYVLGKQKKTNFENIEKAPMVDKLELVH